MIKFFVVVFACLCLLNVECSTQSRGIELHSLIEIALKYRSPDALDAATRAADMEVSSCCTPVVRSKNELKKCVRGIIEGRVGHSADKKIISWVLSSRDAGNIGIIPCASSYEVYGEINVEEYLKKNGYDIVKIRCGKDNGEANGRFIYKCSKSGVSPFYLLYIFSSGSGGYDFSVELYIRELPANVIDETDICTS